MVAIYIFTMVSNINLFLNKNHKTRSSPENVYIVNVFSKKERVNVQGLFFVRYKKFSRHDAIE